MNEKGSSTLVALTWVTVLVLVAAGMAGAGRLVAAHTQATAAADAAALAAAPVTFLGGNPEGEAAKFAAVNGARLLRCDCRRDSSFASRTVVVEVAQQVDLPVFGLRTVRARAAAEFAPLDLIGIPFTEESS